MAREHLGLLLAGHAVGDSLGSTSEFMSREEVLKLYGEKKSSGWPFAHIGGGHFKWRPGQATDDTQMACIMVRSYIEKGEFDPADIAARLVDWLNTDPVDVGTTTVITLQNIKNGAPWYEGGLKDFHRRPLNASNGSLIRNGIIPGMADSIEDAFRFSLYQSIITHYAPRPVICCAAHTFLIWQLLEGERPFRASWVRKKSWQKMFREIWNEWFESAKKDKIISGWEKNVREKIPDAWMAFEETDFYPDTFNPYVFSPKGGAGYVLTTLQIAIWATQWATKNERFTRAEGYPSEVFEKTGPWVLGWVAMTGGDTNSYGSTAGPLIASALGGFPDEMLEGLEIMKEFGDLIKGGVKIKT